MAIITNDNSVVYTANLQDISIDFRTQFKYVFPIRNGRLHRNAPHFSNLEEI